MTIEIINSVIIWAEETKGAGVVKVFGKTLVFDEFEVQASDAKELARCLTEFLRARAEAAMDNLE